MAKHPVGKVRAGWARPLLTAATVMAVITRVALRPDGRARPVSSDVPVKRSRYIDMKPRW